MFGLARYIISLYNTFINSWSGKFIVYLFDQLLLLTVIHTFLVLMWGPIFLFTIIISMLAYLPIKLTDYADMLDLKFNKTKTNKYIDSSGDIPF